jgi:hypothetical protein
MRGGCQEKENAVNKVLNGLNSLKVLCIIIGNNMEWAHGEYVINNCQILTVFVSCLFESFPAEEVRTLEVP